MLLAELCLVFLASQLGPAHGFNCFSRFSQRSLAGPCRFPAPKKPVSCLMCACYLIFSLIAGLKVREGFLRTELGWNLTAQCVGWAWQPDT